MALRIASIRAGEFSLQAADGGGEPCPRLCGDDIENGLGLGQVEAVVQEGPLREFPPFGRTRPGPEDLFEDGPEDERPAVTVDLQRVFAGVGAGSLQKGDEDLVEDGTRLRGDDLAVVEVVGKESGKRPGRPEQPPGDPFRRRSADADQADPPDAGRGRDGCDGVPEGHGIRASLDRRRQASAWSGPLRAGRITIFRYSPSPRLFVVRVSSFCMAMWMTRRSWAFMWPTVTGFFVFLTFSPSLIARATRDSSRRLRYSSVSMMIILWPFAEWWTALLTIY